MSNKTVRNERRKLTASYSNGIAIALFAIGALSQIIGIVQDGERPLGSAMVALICTLASLCLHWIASSYLGGLEE